jgi:Protein of unknown function (DUF3619)
MNDFESTQRIQRIQRALNQGAEKLPYKVTHRLEQSRLAALARFDAKPSVSVKTLGASLALSGELPLWRQALNFAFPIAAVAIALYAINVSRDKADIDDTAAIDSAMLIDDLPIAAYTDYGYGVFLKNSRQ